MEGVRKFGCGVILCGGKSLRMGFDKCKITIGGTPIYEHIAQRLEGLFDDIILVTNNNTRIESNKYRVVEDIVKERGPIGGIYTGLKYSTSEYVFFTACDMPIVDLKLIEFEINELNFGQYNGAVAINKGFIEPLYSFYSKDLERPIKTNIDKGNYQISKLVKALNIRAIKEEEWKKDIAIATDVFSNLNYLKDLDILKELYGDEVVFYE